MIHYRNTSSQALQTQRHTILQLFHSVERGTKIMSVERPFHPLEFVDRGSENQQTL